MSDPNEPQLTDAQRADWNNGVAFARRVAAGEEEGIRPHLVDRLLSAVDARLSYLESERDHLHARADRATAELLALGRELKQVRADLVEAEETYRLLADHIEKLLPVPDDDVADALLMAAIDDVVKERDQARAEAATLHLAVSASERILGDLSARAGDREDKEGIITDPPQFQLDYWRAVLRPALEASPLAAHAVAVLGAARDYRDEWQAIYSVETNARDSARYQETIAQAKARLRLLDAEDAYRAAIAEKGGPPHG